MGKYPARQLVLSLGATPVGQVTALGPAGSSRDLIDASCYGDDWMDYVVGQQDGSEVDIDLAYDPVNASHIALKAAYDAGDPADFGMTHADSGFDVTFSALMTKFERGGPKDGLLTASMSVKILNPGVVDAAS